MSDTTIQGGQIGSVISMNGSAWAVSGTSQRPLTEGAPVYEGEKIVTENDSNVEIKFADDTILGQGENSATRLDEYVYNGDESMLDFQMLQGALRVVSGEIVKLNPDSFNLETPLATIGIRGTQVMIQIDQGREIIGVDELGEGHQVIISNAFNEVIIDKAGMFSGVDFDGSLIVPDEMPDNFMSTMIRAVPLTLIGDEPRSLGEPQSITPPPFYETIDNQTGEERPGVGMEYGENDEDEEFLAGDFDEDDFDLSPEELEAMLDLETAAGDESGDGTQEFGEVVELGHDPYDPAIGGAGAGPDGEQDGSTPPADGAENEDDTIPDEALAAAPPADSPAEAPPADDGDAPVVLAEDSTTEQGEPTEEGEPTAEATITTESSEDDGEVELALSADGATWDGETLSADDGSWDIVLTEDGYEFTQHDTLAEQSETGAGEAVDIEVTITATDSQGDVGTGTFTVSVTDDGPTATDAVISQEVEDTSVTYNVLTAGAASTGTFGGSLVDVSFAPDNELGGSVTFDADGSISFTPTGGEDGTALFTYTVEDNDGDTATGQLSIELSQDSAPLITTSATSVDEAGGLGSASGTLSVDFGADNDGATIELASDLAEWDSESQTLVAEDSSWQIALTETGYEFTQYEAFDHSEGDEYVIDVTLTATDGDNTVATGEFTVTVTDDGPLAEDAVIMQEYHGETVSYNVFEEGAATLGIDGGTLVDAWLDESSDVSGSVSFDADGTVTYTPVYGEDGTLTINYVVEDDDGDQATAQLDITLTEDHVEGGDFTEDDISAAVGSGWIAAMDSSVDGWEAPNLYDASGEQSSNFPTGGETSMIEVWKAGFKGVYDIDGTSDGYFIEIDYASGTDSIYQTMETAEGNTYALNFAATVRPDAPYGEELIVQVWDGETLITEETITPDRYDTGTQEGWNEYSINFTAQSDETRIVFTEPDFGDPGNAKVTYGVLLDNISLIPDAIPVITSEDIGGDETDGLYVASGDLSVDFGDDESGSDYVLSADNADWDDETRTLTDKDGKWTIELAGATYVFTQNAAISHADTVDPDDVYAIDVTVTATAGDGSITSGSFTVTVDDDGPSAGTAELTQDAYGDDITYNIFTSSTALAGMDGATLTSASLTPGSEYNGTVTYNADGTITYSPAEGETGEVSVDYTVTDGDGDIATSHIAIELAEPIQETDVGDYMQGQGGEVAYGTSGDDTIDGAQGRDVIFGTGGDDSLIGGNSKDVIFGGDGNDVLSGEKGNDKLAGEDGIDTLTGGQGNDTFVFTSPDDDADYILDFESAKDHIELYEATFDLSSDNQGNLSDNQFTTVDDTDFEGGYDFEGATSGIIYASETGSHVGALFYDPDDTVDGDETLIATITEDDGVDISADNIDIV